MKRLLAAFLVLCALVLGGCGTKPQPGQPSPEVTVQKDRVEELLQAMSLEEKVGQMFFGRCPETEQEASIEQYQLGGYILFARDFEGKTKEQVTADIQSYQKAAKIPMLIGVDEEGGTVVRVSRYPEFRYQPFRSPQQLYKSGGLSIIQSDTTEKCELLKSLGINVNLAPVCDVSTNAEDFIYDRSFGLPAEETAEYVATVVNEMKKQNMGSVLKHFPGYGSNADTHTQSSTDTRTIDNFRESDFLPFQAGIKNGAGSVLISHNIVQCMDPDNPSSLSKPVHDILRDELGFDGVIMTDDMAMNAIGENVSDEEAAVSAVLAGNDMLISSNYTVQINAVLQAVRDGQITQETIDQAVRRVLRWKLDLGLL